jgi:hypothetical protein
MANASTIGRPERTPSLGYTKDRKSFTDSGASARRADGKPNGGDVLELRVRGNTAQYGMSKAETLRQVANEFLSEAEATLQHAASQGEQPPSWLQTFMSLTGWDYYHQLREKAGQSDQAITISELAPPTGGAAGLYPPPVATTPQLPYGQGPH